MRLVSVNIERSKHLEKVLPFLEKCDPDVLCVQELLEHNIPQFSELFGGSHVTAPICLHEADPHETEPHVMCVGIFTKSRAISTDLWYYAGSEQGARSLPFKTFALDHCVVRSDVGHGGNIFRVMTTHFTWSPRGQPTDLQRTNMQKLLPTLGGSKDFILTGDFNAPRGGEIFSELSSRYADNIPCVYGTSLDLNLHRAARERSHELIDKMVDGLFTTAGYKASNVELVFGISDHAAIVADITTV